MHQLIDLILHLDVHLNLWATMMGPMLYVLLFLIVFCETGLVIVPFLPGDSLLFALGTLTSIENAAVQFWPTLILLAIAAILGNTANYSIGRFIGPKIFTSRTSTLFNKNYLFRAQNFYERHGVKTIILSRFLPIIRTFAPFVAGIAKMNYFRFSLYNAIGAIAWVSSFLFAGHYFGNMPSIKNNFHIVIIAIIVVSALPAVIEFVRLQIYGTKNTT